MYDLNTGFQVVQSHVMPRSADIVGVDVCRVDQWILEILGLIDVPVATKSHRGRVAQPRRG